MGLRYADRLQWAKECFERSLTVLDVQLGILHEEYESRHPHQDDEDDALTAAEELIRFASEQIDEAVKVLKEGV